MAELKELLFQRTLAAYMDLCERHTGVPSAVFYDQDVRDRHKKFCALYGLIEAAELEDEYQTWKETALAILPDMRTTIFDQITESPEALGAFLAKLNAVDTPWERMFEAHFCPACPYEDCPTECPNEDKRDEPTWWLRLPAEV